MEEITKRNLEELFSNTNYNKVFNLINKIKRLIPPTEENGIDYLDEIITYLNSLINGDDISSFSSYKYTSKYAKEALNDLFSSLEPHLLDEYKKQRDQILTEVSSLENKKDALTSSIDSLTAKRNELIEQEIELKERSKKTSQELSELERKQEELVKNATSELETKKKKIVDEVSSLLQAKDKLLTLINQYNQTISNLSEKEEESESEEMEVTWVPLSEDETIKNEILKSTPNTFTTIIQGLIDFYCDKTGKKQNDATTNLFIEKSQTILTIHKILEDFKDFYTSKASINHLSNKNNFQSGKLTILSIRLNDAINNLKIPKYTKKTKTNKSNIIESSLSKSTIPTNINTLLREIYLQRKLVEATIKQKEREKEIEMLINIIKSIAPENADLSSLLPLTDEENKLKLS